MSRERNERLQIMLSSEEVGVVDNWRFERRMPTRAAAIRELLRRGLGAEGFELAPPKPSKDFKILPDDDE